jgi:hypothetical protein
MARSHLDLSCVKSLACSRPEFDSFIYCAHVLEAGTTVVKAVVACRSQCTISLIWGLEKGVKYEYAVPGKRYVLTKYRYEYAVYTVRICTKRSLVYSTVPARDLLKRKGLGIPIFCTHARPLEADQHD